MQRGLLNFTKYHKCHKWSVKSEILVEGRPIAYDSELNFALNEYRPL